MNVSEPINIGPYCQGQSLLFPPNLLDFIEGDDPCMVVDDIVKNIDGSKFKANAANRQAYDKKRVEREIESILDKAEQKDQEEDAIYGPDKSGDELPEEIRDRKQRLKRLKQIQKKLEQDDSKKLNATDEDAVFMRTRSAINTAYNGQVSADEDVQVIVAAAVTNQQNDQKQLEPMIEKTEQNTDASIDILTTDAGYSTPDNLEKLESREIDAYIPDDTYQGRSRGKAVSPFDRDNFLYNETEDTFTCPAGKTVYFWYATRNRGSDCRIYRCQECVSCQHFGQCTTSKRGRTIRHRLVDEKIKAMRLKLDSEQGNSIYAKRKHIVEPVFCPLVPVLCCSEAL